MKNKITTDIKKCLKLIEREETTFARKRKRLLEKYKEIYTISNYSYDDLIDRKIFLQSSGSNLMSVYLPIILAVFSTFIFNYFSEIISAFNWDKSIIFLGSNMSETSTHILNQGLSCVFSLLFAVPISILLAKVLNKSSRSFDRYNTIELEIKIIDEILAKQSNLVEAKQQILEGYFGGRETEGVPEDKSIGLSGTHIQNDALEKQVEREEHVDETKV